VSFLFPFLKGRWKKSADNKKIGKKMAATERYVYAKKNVPFLQAGSRRRGDAAPLLAGCPPQKEKSETSRVSKKKL
jgi:hypothetical protein